MNNIKDLSNNINERQRHQMLNTVVQNLPSFRKPVSKELRELLAKVVNEVEGPTKTPKAAWKSWTDWRKRTEEKMIKAQYEKRTTGKVTIPISKLEKRLIKLMLDNLLPRSDKFQGQSQDMGTKPLGLQRAFSVSLDDYLSVSVPRNSKPLSAPCTMTSSASSYDIYENTSDLLQSSINDDVLNEPESIPTQCNFAVDRILRENLTQPDQPSVICQAPAATIVPQQLNQPDCHSKSNVDHSNEEIFSLCSESEDDFDCTFDKILNDSSKDSMGMLNKEAVAPMIFAPSTTATSEKKKTNDLQNCFTKNLFERYSNQKKQKKNEKLPKPNEALKLYEKTEQSREENLKENLRLKKAKLALKKEKFDFEKEKFAIWQREESKKINYLAQIENHLHVLVSMGGIQPSSIDNGLFH